MRVRLFLWATCALIAVTEAALAPNGSCPIFVLLPFSVIPGRSNNKSKNTRTRRQQVEDVWTTGSASRQSFSFLAAAQMAVEHFNSRNGRIVPQVATDTADCSVQFPPMMTVRDSQLDSATGIQEIWRAASSATNNNLTNPHLQSREDIPFCAILGPIESRTASQLQGIVEAFDVPLLNFYMENDLLLLDSATRTISLVPSQKVSAQRLAQYLQRPGLERQYLAATQTTRPDSSFMGRELLKYAPREGLTARLFTKQTGNNRVIYRDMEQSGIRTVRLTDYTSTILYDQTKFLQQTNMFSDNYLYILHHEAVQADQMERVFGELTVDSSMDQLLKGAAVLDRLDGFDVPFEFRQDQSSSEDPFLLAWREQGQDMVERLNRYNPLDPDHPGFWRVPDNYFQTTRPLKYSSYVYDAIIALGLGACRYEAVAKSQADAKRSTRDSDSNSQSNNTHARHLQAISSNNTATSGTTTGTGSVSESSAGRPNSGGSNGPNSGGGGAPGSSGASNGPGTTKPNVLVDRIVEVSFVGASGNVSFGGQYRNARSASGVVYGAYNVRPNEINPETGKRSFSATLTSVWTQESTGWQDVEPFFYRSGSTNPPKETLAIASNNYLSAWVRGLGLSLWAISLSLNLSGAVALKIFEKERVVAMAQPSFLYVQCLGCILTSAAIFTLSWDEGAGWSQRQLDIACVLSPWFAFVGDVLIFSAMFTRLMRLHRVLQFQRSKVTARNAAGPLLALLLVTIILLSLWTALDPWTWHRELIAYNPPETYGQCMSESMWVYLGPLMGLILFSEVTTAIYVWKTLDAQVGGRDLKDARHCLYSICTHIQAWLVGIPILAVLRDGSADATYLGRVLLIWIFATASVLFTVWPCIYQVRLQRLNSEDDMATSRVHVSGLTRNSAGVPPAADDAPVRVLGSTVQVPFTPAGPSRSFFSESNAQSTSDAPSTET